MSALTLARISAPAIDTTMVRPAIVYVALFAAVGTFFPYASLLLESRGLDLATIGVLLAFNGVVNLLVAPAWGALADRAGDVGRVLLAASLVAALGAVALAVAGDPVAIAAALALLAAGTGGMIPLADTRAVALAGDSRERFAHARAWGSAAFIAASMLAGRVLTSRSPDTLLLLYSPLLVVTGIAAWRLLVRHRAIGDGWARRQVRGRREGLVTMLRRPGLLTLLAGVTVIWTAVGAVLAFASMHLAAEGADFATVGLIWAVGAVVEVPIMLAFPTLARRFGSRPLLVVGLVAFALRAAGWAFLGEPGLAVVVAPLGGIGFALFYVGIVGVVARAVPAGSEATAQGLFTGMTFSLGLVVGSAAGGAVAPAIGLSGLFAASAATTVLGAVVVMRGVTTSTRGSLVRRNGESPMTAPGGLRRPLAPRSAVPSAA
jgi:MFS transporter, PPP family, 3-phenylpropionic acid transporter